MKKNGAQLAQITAADLRRDINIAELVERLPFSDTAAASASQEQAVLFFLAATYRVKRMKFRQRAEAALKEAKSRKGSSIRRKLTDRGIRATEGMVSEELTKDEEIKELEEKLAKREAAEELSKLLLEAYRMRRDSLRLTADLIGAEIYVQRKLEGADTQSEGLRGNLRRQLREKWPHSKRREV